MYIFWLLLIIAVMVGWYFFTKDNRKISAILREQAQQRNGSIKNVFASYPQLLFSYKEVDLLVSAMHGANGPFTYAQFYLTAFPDSYSFRLISKSMPTKVMETRPELKRVEINNLEFDNKFTMRAAEKEFATALLNREIQDKLLELDSRRGLEVSFLNEKTSDAKGSVKKFIFNISVECLLVKNQDYERLTEAAIMLYEQMKRLAKK